MSEHYNINEIEVINFIEQVTKDYPPAVAFHIGDAIKYIAADRELIEVIPKDVEARL